MSQLPANMLCVRRQKIFTKAIPHDISYDTRWPLQLNISITSHVSLGFFHYCWVASLSPWSQRVVSTSLAVVPTNKYIEEKRHSNKVYRLGWCELADDGADRCYTPSQFIISYAIGKLRKCNC